MQGASHYGVLNNRLLPTQITDPDGNYIQIAYKNISQGYTHQAIDYVRDTLGRVITFSYDSLFALRGITVPAFDATGQNQIYRTIRFDYQDRALSYNFGFFTGVENAYNGQPLSTLRHIYLPETQSGYLFTYSDYGMIYNVSSRRQMSVNFNTDPFGVISDGVESASASFNYPTS